MREAVQVSPEHPILIDKFLEDAIEIDVDAVSRRRAACVVGGVMEHIEKAGVHSGDAACALPPYSLGEDQVSELRVQTRAMARALGVVGLINVQFAIRSDDDLRAGGEPARLPHGAVRVQGDRACRWPSWPRAHARRDAGRAGHAVEGRELAHIAVKESVFPFVKFPGVDAVLGPEMKSTGEVMGIDRDFRKAYLKSQIAAGSCCRRLGQGLRLGQESRQARR